MPMSPPLVSVLIPAFNAAAYLEDCLASVWLQVGEFELDVIVIDDGSTDATAAIVGRHAAARLLQQTQHGPAAARNAGITVARGDFIAFLDADDLWPAGSLKARMDVLLNHRDAAMVFGDCRQFDSGGEWNQTLFEAGRLGPVSYTHLTLPTNREV